MIDDKRLLCAFIYSAYESGYCGLMLKPGERTAHMGLYSKFVQDGQYFPNREIEATQGKMTEQIGSTSVRDYIYAGHIDVVQQRIQQDFSMDFWEAVKKSRPIRLVALSCPIRFYKVLAVQDGEITGRNLFLNEEVNLRLLEGLERPRVNDIVSGHWNYFLEVVDPSRQEFNRYMSLAEQYAKAYSKNGL